MSAQNTKAKAGTKSRLRRLALRAGLSLLVFLILWSSVSVWYVRHPRQWLIEHAASLPRFVVASLSYFGNPIADFTDAMDWTGHDAVYEYDLEAPSGSVTFAGCPIRTGYPAPTDIRVINRGDFIIGWSDSLRHPVWCAYHVTPDVRFENLKRPGFTKDRSITSAPAPDDYRKTGYDRGHMAPNHAIASRYGTDAQKLTFRMSNIAPQSPALNRGVWRDVEHRIADFWTRRFGEIWVVVGAISHPDPSRKLGTGDIDIPTEFYQVVLAQEGMDVRALAVIFPQQIPWSAWAARNIISIDELEKRTGLDFNPDLPDFIQSPLEADLPTRLWPIRKRDIFKLFSLRFN